MRVIIIEDEKPAIDKLEKLLFRYDSDIEILAKLVTVGQSVEWLNEFSDQVDLIFMDIKLSDGMSFEIFDHVKINIPIIFVTAYNEYALKAFEVNSIDYLLKPLNYEDLEKSLIKLNSIKDKLSRPVSNLQVEQLNEVLKQFNKAYKSRFMVKVGEHIRSVKTDNIALFYAEGRTVFLQTMIGKRYIIDFKLEGLEDNLDPELFFRVNRSFIVNINSISDVIVYSNSRLKVLLNSDFDKEIIVSRDKVSQLKQWFS